MFGVKINESEKLYLCNGIAFDLRLDGRSKCDYRPMELETDVITNANGSARFRLGNSDILVGVKASICPPLFDKPDDGILEFFLDCSANAAPEFSGRGGEDLSLEICASLSKSYNVFSKKNLCIIPAHKCWKLNVDVLILECGGNLYDAVSLAVKSALFSAKIPKVTGTYVDEGEAESAELELSDDLHDCWKLDISAAPLYLTILKINDHLLVDPIPQEEFCSSCSIIAAVRKNGQISTFFKSGSGSIHENSIMEAINLASKIGMQLHEVLDDALNKEQALADPLERISFLK